MPFIKAKILNSFFCVMHGMSSMPEESGKLWEGMT